MSEVIQAVKGFDSKMQCRGKQYAVGETYVHGGKVQACSSGFHSCENPLDVFSYYPPADSHYASVEAFGAISREANGDSKIASGSLRIVAKIAIPDLVARSVAWILARIDKSIPQAATNTGDRSAATNTGNRSAATNTGNWSAATNTGNWSAATNTGDRSAATNTGNRSAATNTGDRSAAIVEGEHSVAMACGAEGEARASKGSALVLCYRDPQSGAIKHVWAGIAGRKGVKPDTFYTLNSRGKPRQVKA